MKLFSSRLSFASGAARPFLERFEIKVWICYKNAARQLRIASGQRGQPGCWQPTAAAREGTLRPCGAGQAPRL